MIKQIKISTLKKKKRGYGHSRWMAIESIFLSIKRMFGGYIMATRFP
ncbi:MAG: hypothetical protein ACTHJ7_07830 [Candidatus Nitrosocosmicus sp.]